MSTEKDCRHYRLKQRGLKGYNENDLIEWCQVENSLCQDYNDNCYYKQLQASQKEAEQLQQQNIELEKRVEELEELLKDCIDPLSDECRYDHHDYCQSHFGHERPCPYERAKQALQTKQSNGGEG